MKKTFTAALIAGVAVLGAAGVASATDHAEAEGFTTKSPGVASGNLVQIPAHVPVNVNGNTANVVGVGNSAHDNISTNF